LNNVSFSGSYHFLQKQQGLFCAYCGKMILADIELKKIGRMLEGKKGLQVAELLSPYVDRFCLSKDVEPLNQLLELAINPKYKDWSFKNLAMLLSKKDVYSPDSKKTLENLLSPIVFSVEHTTPKSKGGLNTYGNYLPMHRSCNSWRSSESYGEILAENPSFVENIKKSLQQIKGRMASKDPKEKINLSADYFDKVTDSIASQGIDKGLLLTA